MKSRPSDLGFVMATSVSREDKGMRVNESLLCLLVLYITEIIKSSHGHCIQLLLMDWAIYW